MFPTTRIDTTSATDCRTTAYANYRLGKSIVH
jgi:hypothetical protein